MKYLSGILMALAAVGTVASRELIPSLIQLQAYTVQQGSIGWDLYEGLVLGLQQNSDNKDHQCYVSFQTIKGDIQKMPDYLEAISSPNNSDNSIVSALTNYVWFQPATYFKLAKKGQEMGALFFDVYE